MWLFFSSGVGHGPRLYLLVSSEDAGGSSCLSHRATWAQGCAGAQRHHCPSLVGASRVPCLAALRHAGDILVMEGRACRWLIPFPSGSDLLVGSEGLLPHNFCSLVCSAHDREHRSVVNTVSAPERRREARPHSWPCSRRVNTHASVAVRHALVEGSWGSRSPFPQPAGNAAVRTAGERL